MKWIIYFAAWTGRYKVSDHMMEPTEPKAWSPYLEFSTTIRLDEAIKLAKVLVEIMPEHHWAISVKDKDGWAWRDDGREPEFSEDGS